MTNEPTTAKIIKLRYLKEYKDAKNHVAVGVVLEETPNYIRMHCKTYHFQSHNYTQLSYTTGETRVRWFPWSRITVITELPADLDWEHSEIIINQEGRLAFEDEMSTSIEADWEE